jgi:hypothetical protein
MDRIQRSGRGLSGLAGMEKREVAQMSTVQIYGADMAFLNEIPFRCVQDAEQYADQLKKTDPTRTYLVVDDSGQPVSMR